MSNNLTTCNLTSSFIDLATYDELEKYMYGGPEATAKTSNMVYSMSCNSCKM